MAEQSVWLNALRDSLSKRSGERPSAKANWLSLRRRNDFENVCEEVEQAIKESGGNPSDPEWQAAKSMMKAIYERSREAADRGYNFYQFPLGTSEQRATIAAALASTDVQDSLRMWSRKLGWESADLVDWTAVAIGRPSNAVRPLPHRKEEYTMRLQGFFAARIHDRRLEHYGYPVLRTVRERMG